MDKRWDGFASSNYRIEDLGRPAVFLIPLRALYKPMKGTRDGVEEHLRKYLSEKFGAFTVTEIPSFGIWRNDKDEYIKDACVQYEVAFLGKDRIPELLEKLAKIAHATDEVCIYVKAGEDVALLYPSPETGNTEHA